MPDDQIRQREAFVLDDRSLVKRLDDLRAYCQLITVHDSSQQEGNLAQVLLGKVAGASAPPKDMTLEDVESKWAQLRDYLVRLYESPEHADGKMPPEHAFLLTVLGLLETPRALLNTFPDRHRDLYYREMLGMTERPARSDTVAVKFVLDETVRELELPLGLLLDAQQDSAGTTMRYALMQPLSANQAKVTDLRWVVKDETRAGGRRARVVWDEANGLSWPAGGVRLFAPAPVQSAGAAQPDADHDVMTGRIIGSDMFAVPGGKRTWTLHFKDNVPKLKAEMSIGGQWTTFPESNQKVESQSLILTLEADGGEPVPLDVTDGVPPATPQVKLTRTDGCPVPEVLKIDLKVENAQGVHCISDSGDDLTAGGLPYGELADVGAGVRIASPQWWRLGRRMKAVTMVPVWAGLPKTSFVTWYGSDVNQAKPDWFPFPDDAYFKEYKLDGQDVDAIPADSGYTLLESMKDGFPGEWSVRGHDADLLDRATKSPCSQLSAASQPPQAESIVYNLFGNNCVLPHGSVLPDSDNPAEWPWLLRFELLQSFGQAEYEAHLACPPRILQYTRTVELPQQKLATGTVSDANKASVTTTTGDKGSKITTEIPIDSSPMTLTQLASVVVPNATWNPPYLPRWSGVHFNYSASDAEITDQQVIAPFGVGEMDDGEAEAVLADLYVGIDGIEAHQQLSLYWKLAHPVALKIDWQYLGNGGRWYEFGGAASDGTGEFAQSGSWSVQWPDDAARETKLLPVGRFWVRGRVTAWASGGEETEDWKADRDARLPEYGWLTDVMTNVVEARLVAPESVASTHFAQGLAAGTIGDAIDAPPGVQELKQPWPSTGGAARETTSEFYARVARRLRHRNRALNNTDIMLLLKEHDPEIRELLVRENGRATNGSLAQQVIVMPRLGDDDDPRRPAYYKSKLNAMRDWLKARASPWLEIECVSPVYVRVDVCWDVEYAAGVSRSVVDARIQAAIEHEYLPWVPGQGDAGMPAIGRQIIHSEVREVIRSVKEVRNVNSVWLNGSDDVEKSPTITEKQIAIVTCVPIEYRGITVSISSPEPARVLSEMQRPVPLTVGGPPVSLIVTYPNAFKGIPVFDEEPTVGLELMDCDSGAVFWSTLSSETAGVTHLIATDEWTLDLPDESEMSGVLFAITAVPGACGVKRIAAIITLTGKNKRTLRLNSAQIGQSVELRISPAKS